MCLITERLGKNGLTKGTAKTLDMQTQGLTKVLLAASGDPEAKRQARKLAFENSKQGRKGLKARPGNRPSLQIDQSAYYKKSDHWENRNDRMTKLKSRANRGTRNGRNV